MDDAGSYLKALAEALAEAARLNHETNELIQQQFAFLSGTLALPAARRIRVHRGPTNPLHQTWRGFAEDLRQLETHARREQLKLTRANVARFGVDTSRTILRTMEWYGLSKTDWPPSTWDPNEARAGGENS